MNIFSEKRKSIRKAFKAPILVKESQDGPFCRGRIANYSENGIYFETDTSLGMNTMINIKIEGPPYPDSVAISSGTTENFRVKIRWKKQTKENFFNFGYGAAILNFEQQSDLTEKKPSLIKNLRKHPRKPFSRVVYFVSDGRYYKGSITDISRGGMFVETQDSLHVGQAIKLVIPGTRIDSGVMLKAEIIRIGDTGVGAKFTGITKRETNETCPNSGDSQLTSSNS